MNTKESVLLFKSKEASSKTWAFVWLTCMLTVIIEDVLKSNITQNPHNVGVFV